MTVDRSISVVTPTLGRPVEVSDLIANLAAQERLPDEVIIVDGAGPDDRRTETVVVDLAESVPYQLRYLRSNRGTAIQRNAGIEVATGGLVAFIDDDVRLAPECLRVMSEVFLEDVDGRVGGVSGYRYNMYVDTNVGRWRWYRKLRLLSTFESGFYDWTNGYPINSCSHPPFDGVRPIEFMSTASAMWRREVLDGGLRFDEFFTGYGVLEDAQFSLRAGRDWVLVQCGDALCEELHSPNARTDQRQIGYKCVVNYWYVFNSVAGPLRWRQRFGFWRYQTFELGRVLASGLRRRRPEDLANVRGRLQGIAEVMRGGARPGGGS